MDLNTSLSSICPSLKFKWCPVAFLCLIKEMPPDVTHCDDRFPYNSLVFLLFPWLPVDTCNISSWCCAVGDKNPPPIPFHRLKSPCWVDPTAASSLTKVIRWTGRVDDHARAHLAVSRGYLCRRSVAGGEPSSFLCSAHQPRLWLEWLCSARREVSLIRPHDSWPKQEETSSNGARADNTANFPNWEKKKKSVQRW